MIATRRGIVVTGGEDVARVRAARVRRAFPSLALAGALLVAACSIEPPLERRNPFDPDGIYEFALDGPDSAHFIGEVLQFTLVAEPELPPGNLLIHWDVLDEVSDGLGRPTPSPHVNPGPNGSFVVRSATARYRKQTATGSLEEVQFGKAFWLGQKVVSFALTCPFVSGPTDECPVSNGATQVTLGALMEDAAGASVGEPAYAFARAHVTSRTPQSFSAMPVVQMVGLQLQRNSGGSSWVVVTIDEAIDSIRVFVP